MRVRARGGTPFQPCAGRGTLTPALSRSTGRGRNSCTVPRASRTDPRSPFRRIIRSILRYPVSRSQRSSCPISKSSARSSRRAISRRRSTSSSAGIQSGQKFQTLMGVTGSGKTFTMANTIAADQQADAGHQPQQNARGPALRGVQGAFPAQRGRLFRQLLRLLPARSVHPAARHLHRERRQPQ